MNGENFITDVRKVGIGIYEARTYWILKINGGWLKASQIAETTKVPQSRIYDVLQSLRFKGLIRESNTVVKSSKWGNGWNSKKTLNEFIKLQRRAKKLGYVLHKLEGNKKKREIKGRANIKIYKALKLDKFLNKKINEIEKIKSKYGIV